MAELSPTSDYVPEGTFEAELSDDQVGAIKQGIRLGKVIQERHPEVVEDYRSGLSLSAIVEKYDLKTLYKCSQKILEMAVLHAIKGYDGHLRVANEDAYQGLIHDKEELKRIGSEHNKQSSSVLGQKMAEEGTGIFGMSADERSEVGRRSGKKQYEEGIGIHAQTPEERRELAMKGLESQGKTPFSGEELGYIKELTAHPSFQRRSRINAMKIAEEVNRKFHQGETVRDSISVTKIINRLKSGERNITKE